MTHTRYALVQGVGYGRLPLTAFDRALGNAGVRDYNLVQVTSVIPPGAKAIWPDEIPRGNGEVLHIAYARAFDSCPLAGVAVATPLMGRESHTGVIVEATYYAGMYDDLERGIHNLNDRLTEMANTAMMDRGISSFTVTRIMATPGRDNAFEERTCSFAGVVLLP